MKKKPTKVYRYDGQSIWTSDSSYPSYSDYELGSFLGGGAAGVVYEAECFKTKRHLAVKVLNPIGYKLAPSGSLRFCEVVVKGLPYGDVPGALSGGRGSRGMHHQGHGAQGSSSGASGAAPGKMSEKHVWWLVNSSTRQVIAAYYDARTGVLKEMTLPKCIEVWGLGDDKGRRVGERGGRGGRERSKRDRDRDRDRLRPEDRLDRVFVGGEWLTIPTAPLKYDKFLRARASIFREINNMLQLSEHPNILRLHEALEFVQDSKATIFLVLELARGGELFDRIKVDCGADEGAARQYFKQLLSGVRHCHDRGVCHRDLKPENLLLANPDDASVLKIADFGFSALFRELETESSSGEDSSEASSTAGTVRGSRALPPTVAVRARAAGVGAGVAGGGAVAGGTRGSGKKGLGRGVRRLTSVVGSPYYVAPEVLREESGQGYDGTKADVWSMGVILYAMLAGNLPFEKELLTCPRFAKFGAWARQPSATASLRAHCSGNPKDAMDMDCLDYPSWFFPQHFSFAARSLLAGLLHPDASSRLSVRQALRHPWVLNGGLYRGSSGSSGGGGSSSSDGSEFGGSMTTGPAAAHRRDTVVLTAQQQLEEPDPQHIPSELLGDDTDTEEERERGGSHLERKDGRDDYCSRGGRVDGSVADSRRGVSAAAAAAGVVGGRAGMSTTDRRSIGADGGSTTAAVAAMPGDSVAVGISEIGSNREQESSQDFDTTVLDSADGQGGRGSSASGVGSSAGEAGRQKRQPNIPGPAPPPPPPPVPSSIDDPAVSSRSVVSGRGRKEGVAGVTAAGRGCGRSGARDMDTDLLAGRLDRLSLLRAAAAAVAAAGGGNEGVADAAAEVVRVLSTGSASSIGKKNPGNGGGAVGGGTGDASDSGRGVSGSVSTARKVADATATATTTATPAAAIMKTKSSVEVVTEAAEEESLAARGAAATKAAAGSSAPGGSGSSGTESGSTPCSPLSRRAPEGNPLMTPEKLLIRGGGRSRPLDVFSSPPLAPLGAGRTVENEESEFALDSGSAPLPPDKRRARSSSGREGLPPSGASHYVRLASGGGGGRLSSTGERALSMGVAGIAMVEGEEGAGVAGGRRDDGAGGAGVAATPPAFHDLVKRSTRFMTSVPAAVVLRKIATIINGDAHPLPYPYRNIKQKAVVYQDDYKLEIMRGGVLVCTVQIYLLGGEHRAAQYMVEFLRGQLDIFLFKRFYEDVRCKLNDLVKKDYSLALLESGTYTHRFRHFSNLA